MRKVFMALLATFAIVSAYATNINHHVQVSSYCNIANQGNDEYGPWRKSYFRNKWDEYDYSRPFMTIWLPSNVFNVNLGLLYCDGRFTFKLFDNDRDVREIYASEVNISFRCEGQEIEGSPLKVVEEEVHFTHHDDVAMLSTLFNKGRFQICMEFESYTTSYRYVWNVDHNPGVFSKAVKALLGKPYRGIITSSQQQTKKPSTSSSAYTFKLEGTIGTYPIVMELNIASNGTISGRYAYKSTLQKKGYGRDSYLYIKPDGQNGNYIIRDSTGKVCEHWSNCDYNIHSGYTSVWGNVRTASGKVLELYADGYE